MTRTFEVGDLARVEAITVWDDSTTDMPPVGAIGTVERLCDGARPYPLIVRMLVDSEEIYFNLDEIEHLPHDL